MLTVAAGQSQTPSIDPSQDAKAPVEEKQEPVVKEAISGAPPAVEQKVIHKEEQIEYRDQEGNLLNDEQVAALEGKVEFQTKYETKTRVVDEHGNEVQNPDEAIAGVAPPHPDVEGVDQQTVKKADEKAEPVKEQDVAASKDGEREQKVKEAKPASEGKEATIHEEL